MARSRFLETDTRTLEELLGNGRQYRVPAFQRDFSWDEEQLEDLWLDLTDTSEGALPHDMGSLVLQNDAGALRVIDGQQRLATLSIVCLAVLERLQARGDDQRYNLLKAQYIGAKDPASLR